MIRAVTHADADPVCALAVATGLAPPDGTAELAAVLAACLNGEQGPDHVWLADDEGGLQAVAYVAPERLTDGTWNLYLIAVQPGAQNRGRGTALLRHVEELLQARGARVLIVDTSGLPEFERTRAFYRKCGYDEEARIRDYWKAGDDKIVFRKALAG